MDASYRVLLCDHWSYVNRSNCITHFSIINQKSKNPMSRHKGSKRKSNSIQLLMKVKRMYE